MKLLLGLESLRHISVATAVSVGNFDGVHLGHQVLCRRLLAVARARDLATLLVLFEPQPAEFFHREIAPDRIYSLREKLMHLLPFAIDYVCCVRFDARFARMSPEMFGDIILHQMRARYLLLGLDFRFGYERAGDIAWLQQRFMTSDCSIEILPDYQYQSGRVSSTLIRQRLQQHAWHDVTTLLGRPYSLIGRVVPGRQLARQYGFPTANVRLMRKTVPLRGVYCVRVNIWMSSAKAQGVSLHKNAIANIGIRPTVDGNRLMLEVHVLDCTLSLYGAYLEVIFLHRVREEQRFSSIEHLFAQIGRDVQMAQTWFETHASVVA